MGVGATAPQLLSPVLYIDRVAIDFTRELASLAIIIEKVTVDVLRRLASLVNIIFEK